MALELLDGSEAIAEAAIAAGCKFYSGYPMSPSTELLEHFAAKMPLRDGVCINADTEIEGVNMALGAAAAGFRAATGSTGQGVALMQEAIADAALTETPLVVFTIARMQQDYFQCTRGGGWGDYRTPVLAPKSVDEAVEHTQLIFDLAERYRTPAILLADNILVRTLVGVDVSPIALPPLPDRVWGHDGSTSGSGKSKQIWGWRIGKPNTPGVGVNRHWEDLAEKYARIAELEARSEQAHTRDADVVVLAFGTAARFVEYVVDEMRAEGLRVGYFRPITLWPFPGRALAEATRNAKRVAVFELNAGQMIEDVMMHVEDRSKVVSIGGISSDWSGINIGPLMAAQPVRERIRTTLEEVAA